MPSLGVHRSVPLGPSITDDQIDDLYADLRAAELSGDTSRVDLLTIKIEAAEHSRATEMAAYAKQRCVDFGEYSALVERAELLLGERMPLLERCAELGIEVRRVRELTEWLERDTFSGGVNLSARERNAKRLKCYLVKAQPGPFGPTRDYVVVCDNTWRALQGVTVKVSKAA